MKNLPYDEYIRELEADPRTLVRVERPREHTAVVWLDDPGNMNALSGELTVQLKRKLSEALADPSVRSVVLTGTDPFFSVGGDWKLMEDRGHTYVERAEGTVGLWKWIRQQFGGIARLIAQSDTPVVIALNGPVAGVALAPNGPVAGVALALNGPVAGVALAWTGPSPASRSRGRSRAISSSPRTARSSSSPSDGSASSQRSGPTGRSRAASAIRRRSSSSCAAGQSPPRRRSGTGS